jgi:hypothetical protein
MVSSSLARLRLRRSAQAPRTRVQREKFLARMPDDGVSSHATKRAASVLSMLLTLQCENHV